MKRVFVVIVMVALIIVTVAIHMNRIFSFCGEILKISEEVLKEYENSDWDKIYDLTIKTKDIWNKNRLWAAATLSTKVIDEIEISLEQSIMYSKIKSNEDFIGEYKMFCMLIEHLPKQEGVDIAELL